MPAPAHSIELWIPDARPSGRGGRRNLPPVVPFLSTTPYPGWEYEEGEIRWTVAGAELLDGRFGLYPFDQIDAVVGIVELAAARKPGAVNVPGSVITLSTTPLGPHHARFAADVPERRVRSGLRGRAEHAEATAGVSDVVGCVVPAVRAWMLHVPLIPPPRPRTDPGPGTRDERVEAVLARLDAIESRMRR